jgi:hypothetical protein
MTRRDFYRNTLIRDQHKYNDEQRDFLQRWADHLDALTAPKVIAINLKQRA